MPVGGFFNLSQALCLNSDAGKRLIIYLGYTGAVHAHVLIHMEPCYTENEEQCL